VNPVPWLIPGPLHAVLVGAVLVLWLHRRRGRASVNARRLSLLALAWLWIGATPALGNLLVQALENRHPAVDIQAPSPGRSTPVVLVLASGQMFKPDGRISLALDADGWERMLAGIALWRQVGGTLLLAGGPGEGATDSLAHLMRRVALDAGVPEAAIVTAGGGRNTYEDLRSAAARLRSQPPDGVVWLVTSALHMPRAVATTNSLGL
jgi:uncharacterized SAM-binding protein YcdF (DUF218 family)